MVLDTSVILSVFFKEQFAEWSLMQMNKHANELRMSTVNLTETLIRLQDRQPQLFPSLKERLLYSGIRFVSPDIEQAQIAADARIKYPLNLGDCFAYALAVQEDCPILTLDQDFKIVDRPIIHPTKNATVTS
ncbi:MAG TPA: type II toxin-antitoxin system VapC family toxin [Gammaproteobacteria bacterium]|nr:type II toxin-antitoxin system VapC family toxin [Gammaproteobacteria bacterium]